MTTEDKALYLYRPLDYPLDKMEADFIARYGVKPAKCEPWVISHWPKEEPWGYVIAGPVPQQGEDGQG